MKYCTFYFYFPLPPTSAAAYHFPQKPVLLKSFKVVAIECYLLDMCHFVCHTFHML